MKQSQIQNYTNPTNSRNTSYTLACLVAKRYNDAWVRRALLRLPKAVNVVALPLDRTIPEEPFTQDMVLPGGFLFDIPLNHHLVLDKGDGPVIIVNAGYLATLMLYNMNSALLAIYDICKEPPYEDNPPTETDSPIQTQSPSLEE